MSHRATYRRIAINGTIAGGLLACASPTLGQITFGQLDDFQDGTTMGWVEGPITPNPPTNIPNGGPNGAGDAFLQNISSGGFGAGSKQIMFNQTQWIGDYGTAHVTRISGMMANPGATDLHMRVAIQGGVFGTIFSSANAVFLPSGSAWQPVSFDLTTTAMALVAGPDPLSTVLSSVAQLRVLSSELGPSFTGDVIVSTLNVDNLRAMTRPGDANFDGVINLNDFNILAGNFGTAAGATWGQADFNFDGAVNLVDFNLLAGNFGQTVGPEGPTPQQWSALAAAVPEPASLVVLGLGAALIPRGASRRSRTPR